MIDSARRTVSELGLRHARLEVEQFAGIVELVADDPAAAEPHLRKAYNGFRRMGLDADTAETAALLGRTCLALDRDTEADELCAESEGLAGHALKASIASRTLRAQLQSRRGDHDEARRVAEAAVELAERTDALVDHGDACLTLATVLGAAGDTVGARAAAECAADLYERKGAGALVDKARVLLGEPCSPPSPTPTEERVVTPENACVRAGKSALAAIGRGAWDEFERLFAPGAFVESHRNIVGFPPIDVLSREWPPELERYLKIGLSRYHLAVVAMRGERLALIRLKAFTADVSPGAPHDEFLQLYGVDEDGRVAWAVWFDVENMDAAVAELDARFAEQGSEPASQPDNACVRVVERLAAAIDRKAWDEFELLFAPEVFVESRRKVIGFAQTDVPSGEWPHVQRRMLETSTPRLDHVVIAVRGDRLALARVMSRTPDVSPGAPDDQFLLVCGIDAGGRLALSVAFDVDDMDAAIAELDAAHARFEGARPQVRLANAASRAADRSDGCVTSRRWDDLGALFAEDVRADDQRRGIRREYSGRAAAIAETRAIAELGVANLTSSVIAARGERLTLGHLVASGRDDRAGSYGVEMLRIVEVNDDGQITALVTFDLDDIGTAFDELDARFLAGEAADYAHTWSAIVNAHAAINRQELPVITPDLFDHRPVVTVEAGDPTANIRGMWESTPDLKIYIEAVHRLSDLAAVFTQASHGTSQAGFEAEWKVVELVTVEGEQVVRAELFDEADVNAALARFHELHPHERRLENAASRLVQRYLAHFATRDWDAMAEVLADDVLTDDRRHVVSEGVRRGRENEIANVKFIADAGAADITSTPIATRGEHLVLARPDASVRDWPDAFHNQMIELVEINADNQISAHVMFDSDDIDAAFEELDSRYLAGEASAHMRMWSVVVDALAALNRHEMPRTTPDYVIVDHQLQHTTLDPSGLAEYLRASWELTPEFRMYIEAVPRLSDAAAVITLAVHGSSQEGFDADWRINEVVTMDPVLEVGNRCEIFDEKDLDAALAKFDELSRPTPRLENMASRIYERVRELFAVRDWDALRAIIAGDSIAEDRRRMVNAGVQRGRDAAISEMSAFVELGAQGIASTVVATRGEHLTLNRSELVARDGRLADLEVSVIDILEVDAAGHVVARVIFDPDDLDAAIAERRRPLSNGRGSAARTNLVDDQRRLRSAEPP